MNKHLQRLLQILQQDDTLNAEQKNEALQSLKDANKEFEVTAFKLDRTEKVKRTTEILLEETITELEQKRKAVETQNRELEVEASLERIRTRTMAMRRSDELHDAAVLLFEQAKVLGASAWSCGYVIWDEDQKTATAWMGNNEMGIQNKSFKVPVNEYVFKNIFEASQKDEDLFVYEISGEAIGPHYEYMFTLPEAGNRLKNFVAAGGTLPGVQILHCAFFSKGYLLFITVEPIPGLWDVFKRFSNVFEQTYTRFLDLQKAEVQAREAEIELALERVRSKAMAMHSPQELKDVATELRNQMSALGQSDMEICAIHLYDESPDYFESIAAGPVFGPTSKVIQAQVQVRLPKHGIQIVEEMMNQYYSGKKDYVLVNHGKKGVEWFELLKEKVPLAYEFVIQNLNGTSLEDLVYYWSVSDFKGGSLVMTTYVPPDDEVRKVLSRFANVFGLAYQRFKDLQKAEAQARESQIQLALERVRARTMAMHKSTELAEVAVLLYHELKGLGVTQEFFECGYLEVDEANNIQRGWSTRPDGSFIEEPFYLPLTGEPVSDARYEAWTQRIPVFHQVVGGDQWQQHLEFVLPYLGNKEAVEISTSSSIPDPIHFYCGNFSNGYLNINCGLPLSLEAESLLARFTAVFEMTYKRFLDLQKAEAQAREAQIEAALERVRSKTMAMHKSEQLSETAQVLFDQFSILGKIPDRIGIGIINEEMKIIEWWVTDQSGSHVPRQFKASILQPTHAKWFAGWKDGKDTLVVDLSGKELNEWIAFVRDEVNMPIDESKMKGRRIHHSAFFSQGLLLISAHERMPNETLLLLSRFAKVFNQTYTRFLDLQKAEAQAREAQIEASLERVRSKTMAMHNSHDVGHTVASLFDELVALGLEKSARCGIGILDESDTMELWTASTNDSGELILSIGHLNMTLHPLLKGVKNTWSSKKQSFTYELQGEDLISYFNTLNDYPDYNLYIDVKTLPEKIIHNSFYFTDGLIYCFTENSISEDLAKVVKRFAGVFGQTYKRYLDLQKAEAQAREAQIEVALERVRSRSMGMQKSEELKEVIQIVHEQLVNLKIKLGHAGFVVDYKPKGDWHFWIADKQEIPSKITHPYFDSVWANQFNEAKEKGMDFFVTSLNFEEKNRFYRDLFQYVPGLSDESREFYFNCAGLAVSNVLMEDVALYIENFDGIPYTDEENAVLRRFGKVFQQTYTRFLDLQKAETQAREATMRASVDRVRAEIASMRTKQDLDRITPLIWKELSTLDVPFVRCGVFIMEEERQIIHTYLSTPEGKAIAAFDLPYDAPGRTSEILSNWINKQEYIEHWNEIAFSDLGDFLVQQGALPSKDAYLKTVPQGGIHLHCLPFLQGMLYVGNTERLMANDIQLIQSVADAFSTAYARYEDFNKLEAAKKQVDSTLNDLQTTQKQLIQSEKMASLGELTAGIAHEIQNPLNFVNNFSDLNRELVDELQHELKAGKLEEAISISNNIKANEEKINHHGKRADAIVKGMLQHSRSSGGIKEPTDINALCDEYLRLAYHGLRAKDKSFNATLKTDFDELIGNINIIPQDIGRVILNLIMNAFYAVAEKKRQQPQSEPTVSLTTRKSGSKVLISVKDNGNGIDQKVLDKIFQPFFTTKPTGQGTGLGLSLSYDIVKAHGGELNVTTQDGRGSEFIITLPS